LHEIPLEAGGYRKSLKTHLRRAQNDAQIQSCAGEPFQLSEARGRKAATLRRDAWFERGSE